MKVPTHYRTTASLEATTGQQKAIEKGEVNMAVLKVTVQLEGPTQGNVKMYRVGTIKGAVVLRVVGVKGEFRRGDFVTE